CNTVYNGLYQNGVNKMNKIDKIYCMSHYVAFRFIKNENINFFEGLKHKTFQQKENSLYEIFNIADIEKVIKKNN
ncbi:hypothetical protein ACQ76A_001446, partial [Campylobacter coli]